MDSSTLKTRSSTREVKKTWKLREKDEFIPVAVQLLPGAAKPVMDDPIPHFEPSTRVPFDSMTPNVPIRDPIQLFLLLLGEETLKSIVIAINEYATIRLQGPHNIARPRPWRPLTRNELIIWLGTLFFMGRHQKFNREYYWREEMHHFGQYMSKSRWEQIHRFLKVSNNLARQPH